MSEPTQKTEAKQRGYANLKPFKKGQSGNPKGRPKGTVSITTEIKNKLLKIYPKKVEVTDPLTGEKRLIKEKKLYLDKIIEAIFENGIELKDPRTLNQIWAYLDGSPKQTIAGDKENPLRVITMDSDLAKQYGITPSESKNDSDKPSKV